MYFAGEDLEYVYTEDTLGYGLLFIQRYVKIKYRRGMMEDTAGIIELKPTELIKMMERWVQQVIEGCEKSKPIKVKGRLGHLNQLSNQSYYKAYYKVPLRDELNTVFLDIPKELIPDPVSFSNRDVVVSGFIKVKVLQSSALEFRIDVSHIETLQDVSLEIVKKERNIIDLLNKYKSRTHQFPERDSYTICVIHPRSGTVLQDFTRNIGNLDKVDIKPIPTNIQSPESIIQSIKQAEGDIVVIIRGGGDEVDFDVFNDLNVIDAWISLPSFRISAIGHSKDRTYLDIFSDRSCDTPTAAAVGIREEIEKN